MTVAGGLGPEVDLRLAGNGRVLGLRGAGAEEGEGGAVGGPDGAGVGTAGGVGDVDGLVCFVRGGCGDGGEMEGRAVAGAEGPGDGGAVRREGDVAGSVHGVHAALGVRRKGGGNGAET